MRYYSTNKGVAPASLADAVIKGLAADKGLYMPERIERLPQSFFDKIETMTLPDIACRVAEAFFGEDIPQGDLDRIVRDTLSFETPVVRVTDRIWSLEIFHGPN